ncbi:MAG: hypothetical protein ACP5NF_11810 [Thermoanaerobaculum sp.]
MVERAGKCALLPARRVLAWYRDLAEFKYERCQENAKRMGGRDFPCKSPEWDFEWFPFFVGDSSEVLVGEVEYPYFREGRTELALCGDGGCTVFPELVDRPVVFADVGTPLKLVVVANAAERKKGVREVWEFWVIEEMGRPKLTKSLEVPWTLFRGWWLPAAVVDYDGGDVLLLRRMDDELFHQRFYLYRLGSGVVEGLHFRGMAAFMLPENIAVHFAQDLERWLRPSE